MSRGEDDLRKRVIYLVQCIEKELEDGPATTGNHTKVREIENDFVEEESAKHDKSAEEENDQTVVIELDKRSQSEDSGIRIGDQSGGSEKRSKRSNFGRNTKQNGKFES